MQRSNSFYAKVLHDYRKELYNSLIEISIACILLNLQNILTNKHILNREAFAQSEGFPKVINLLRYSPDSFLDKDNFVVS